MINEILSHSTRFLFLMIVQLFLLDHLDIADGMVVPYIYVLFLLMLPFNMTNSSLMLVGFATGFIVDIFSNTLGMHASACVLITFLRHYILRYISPRDGYEFALVPRVQQMGFGWFLTYVGLMVFIHHLWLFFVEVYMMDRFLQTLLRVIMSSAFTVLLCLLAQFLSFSPRKSRS
jgi:rod shape-determining protein MreD